MKKISTLLFAAAVAAPMYMSAADIVTGTAKVELWDAKVVNINNEAFQCPNGPRTAEPTELLGTWTSGEGKFTYNPDTKHYYIENFLNGGEKCTLEFAVGDTPRDYNVYSTPEEGVNVPLMDPIRYDFEVFFKTADGAETYGLQPADYTGYSIVPVSSMVTGPNPFGWNYMFSIATTDGSKMGAFVGEENSYWFKSGLRVYATTPQRSATGKVTPFEPIPAGESFGEDSGYDAPSQAQQSYVVKDEDTYTVYISIYTNGNNKWYLNDQDAEKAVNPAMMLKMSFNKETLAGAENIICDNENAPVEYYNIQGVKIENPANGLYIKRQGDKVSKVILK